MNISIVGTGYVGLISGVGLALKGHKIIAIDVDKEKIKKISAGETPIYEKGLSEALKKVLKTNFEASTDYSEIENSDAVFICVGTPSKADGSIDLTYIFSVAKELGKHIKNTEKFIVVIVKSTVVPGTTEKVSKIIEEESGKRVGEGFGIAMNPEFLKEGNALEDFLNPDRIVLGAEDKKSLNILNKIYENFDAPKLRVNIKTAEMIKYASNALLATKISFINEIGNVCKKLGIDVYDVAKGVGLDSRISPKFLRAGLGFGGSCFPKDVAAIVSKAEEVGEDPTLLNSVLNVNKKQPDKLVSLAKRRIGSLNGKKAVVLGLAFKANTDDVRESRALRLISTLKDEGAEIIAYDPKASENALKVLPDLRVASNLEEALNFGKIIFVATDWEEFKNPEIYSGKIVFDGRHIFDKKVIDEIKDFEYEGICW